MLWFEALSCGYARRQHTLAFPRENDQAIRVIHYMRSSYEGETIYLTAWVILPSVGEASFPPGGRSAYLEHRILFWTSFRGARWLPGEMHTRTRGVQDMDELGDESLLLVIPGGD